MFSTFPSGPRPSLDADLDRILRQPLPDYRPLPTNPALDFAHAPDAGGLAWSLAYGLGRQSIRRRWALDLLTSSGPVGNDPGLNQAWQHAQSYYGHGGPQALLHRPEPCFALPAPVSPPEPTPTPQPEPQPEPEPVRRAPPGPVRKQAPLSPLEEMLTQLTHAVLAAFLANLELHPEPAPSVSPEPLSMERKCAAICHVMNLPWGRKTWQRGASVHPRETPGWSTLAVFRATPAEVRASLRQAADSILDLNRRFPPREVSKQDREQGVASFERYIVACLGRIRSSTG